MGKHEVGYERIDKDLYPTPSWVIDALAEHVDLAGKVIWEPATGTGSMAEALKAAGTRRVYRSDVVERDYPLDEVLYFLSGRIPTKISDFDLIVTNSPYGPRNTLAEKFIEIGLRHINSHGGALALLLPTDFDSAKSRHRLFRDCSAFVARISLTRRIVWFEGPNAAPKENHAWHVWSRPVLRVRQPPIVLYAPSTAASV
jgi:predicted RNA methylase